MEISQTDCVAHSVCLLFCTVKPSVLFCPKDGPLGKVRLYMVLERYIFWYFSDLIGLKYFVNT